MGKNHREVTPFLIHHIKGYRMSICLITGAVKLDHLDTVLSAKFFHCKVTIFSFGINKYLWVGDIFIPLLFKLWKCSLMDPACICYYCVI